jgi:hypothetical protein
MEYPIGFPRIMSLVVLFLGTMVPAHAQDQTPVGPDVTATQQPSRTQQLYGDICERPGPSKRGRGLVTVSTPVTMNRLDQLR